MKKLKFIIMSGIVAMLSACSDSDDSNGSSLSIAGGSDTEQHGLVVIDENNKIIKPYLQSTKEGCFQRGLDFSWQTVDLGVSTRTYKYEFVGDTLVLHEGGEYSSHGMMLVGGTNGNLNGTWKSTLCYYDNDEEEATCYKLCSAVKKNLLEKEFKVSSEAELDKADLEEFEEAYEQKRIKTNCKDDDDIIDYTFIISGDNITFIKEYRDGETENFDDYMNSYYVSSLYEAIYESSTEDIPSIYDFFSEDSADVKKYRRRADIEEINRTKTALDFKVGKTTVSIKVNQLEMDDVKTRANVVVSTDKRTCELKHEAGSVTSSDCSRDNLAKFGEADYREAEDGTKYKLISYMEDTNKDEFRQCVRKILKNIVGADDDDEKKSSKTGTSDDDMCKLYTDSYESCLDVMGSSGTICDYYKSSMDEYCGGSSFEKSASTEKLSWKRYLQLRQSFMMGLESLAQ